MIGVGSVVAVTDDFGVFRARRGRVTADAGLAERGPQEGQRFWWVKVEGTAWPAPLMFRQGELTETRESN